MTNATVWRPDNRWVVLAYFIGVASYASLAIVSKETGPVVYANLLFGLLLPLKEWFRQFGSPTSALATIVSQAIAAALGGVLFPAVLCLFRYELKQVRVLAFVLCGALVIMCVWWGRLPNI